MPRGRNTRPEAAIRSAAGFNTPRALSTSPSPKDKKDSAIGLDGNKMRQEKPKTESKHAAITQETASLRERIGANYPRIVPAPPRGNEKKTVVLSDRIVGVGALLEILRRLKPTTEHELRAFLRSGGVLPQVRDPLCLRANSHCVQRSRASQMYGHY